MKPYERIKYLRKDLLNKKQEDFAAAINISRSNLGNIETGRITLTDRVMSDICKKFNVNADWLLNGTGEPFVVLSAEEEFAAICAELANEHDEFAMQFLKRYWNLDENGRVAIRQMLGMDKK